MTTPRATIPATMRPTLKLQQPFTYFLDDLASMDRLGKFGNLCELLAIERGFRRLKSRPRSSTDHEIADTLKRRYSTLSLRIALRATSHNLATLLQNF